jgi:hypothetical protein
MKNSQMIIYLITKNNDIKITKSTNDNYVIEDKKITFTLNNFNTSHKFMIAMMFETSDTEFVEVVKVSYRYMDVIPTGNNADMTYYDENNKLNYLDIVKKSMVEIRFIP